MWLNGFHPERYRETHLPVIQVYKAVCHQPLSLSSVSAQSLYFRRTDGLPHSTAIRSNGGLFSRLCLRKYSQPKYPLRYVSYIFVNLRAPYNFDLSGLLLVPSAWALLLCMYAILSLIQSHISTEQTTKASRLQTKGYALHGIPHSTHAGNVNSIPGFIHRYRSDRVFHLLTSRYFLQIRNRSAFPPGRQCKHPICPHRSSLITFLVVYSERCHSSLVRMGSVYYHWISTGAHHPHTVSALARLVWYV